MYNKDLKEYIFIENIIPGNICKLIIGQAEKQQWKRIWYSDNPTEKIPSWADNFESTELSQHIINRVEEYARPAIQTYCSMFSFSSLQNIGNWHINRYHQDQYMNTHVDHIYDMFENVGGVPVITIVVNLCDEYTGGEFKFWDTWAPELKQGDLMLFPSNFLYPHQVTPVLSGTRHSLVGWAW